MNARDVRGNKREPSAFDNLLETDKAFYHSQSRDLAHIAASMGVPPSERENVVEETWLAAVKHRHRFGGTAIKLQVVCWLTKVVHSKAINALRRLANRPCESLGAREEDLLDDAEVKQTEATRKTAPLYTLLGRLQREDPDGYWLVCERHLQGRRIRELAAEKGWTLDQVRCRIYRTMEKLRAWLSNSRTFGEDDC